MLKSLASSLKYSVVIYALFHIEIELPKCWYNAHCVMWTDSLMPKYKKYIE